jgi:hypothetical protein
MKKIKITVASILLSGVCFAQTSECCQKTVQEVYEYEGLIMNPEKVLLQRVDHIEAINTLEDMIEWMYSDIDNGIIDQSYGELYIENLQDLLFTLKNKSILIENEN